MFESELNEQQLAAVTHGDGPQLVLAGAGSGKTRVITYRVAWLIRERGVDPASIVAVTFTNKAAGEMRERIESQVGIYPLPTFVGTFHRFALTLLRRWGERIGVPRGFAIFDRDDQIALVKKSLAAEGLSETSFAPRQVLAAISAAKNRLMDPGQYEAEAKNFFEQRVARVYRTYQGSLKRSSAMDFDDMLRLAVRLLEREPELERRLRDGIRHLLVDEFQDTNHAQMRLIHQIAGSSGNLTAVGDEDQGIYRWRGADLSNVLDFERSFPGATVRKLERNYRSTQNILSAAGELVANNEGRRGKTLWTDRGDGEDLELYYARDEQDEARWVASSLEELRPELSWHQMAVLVRTNAQTRALEERFLRERIPYDLVGGVRFYERAEIKDLIAYLRVLRNPNDDHSLARILNKPPRGIGRTTRDLLEDQAGGARQPLWEAIRNARAGSLPARSAKAIEAFRTLIEDLAASAAELPLAELIRELLERTGYAEIYDKADPEAQARRENIDEFVTAAQELTEESGVVGIDALTDFLDHASLVSDVDEWQKDRGVALMTLHAAKGLEFPAVVVAGLEDGLLPHFNAMGTPESLEEERRLLYVGMTRAERKLMLTCCRRRRIAGRYQDQDESPFLAEIPRDHVVVHRSPELFAQRPGAAAAAGFFGRQPARREPFRAPLETVTGDGGSLGKGSRVRHPTLGDGVVLATEGAGDGRKLTVFFDRVGKRKLLARYASLEPV
ncbi:MAG: 3'-5' exonuclease [Thermoanaerobaculia bacterium]|nr:3'-5' exonuclease [Thermoanaerobaculia bacterium]